MERDDLFTPSLQHAPRVRALPRGDRPWRLGSQLYVGFFGGALAVAAVAWENSRRLGAPAETRRFVVVLGVLGVAASVVVAYLLYGKGLGGVRVGYRVVGVLAFGALYKLQEGADRVYSYRAPGGDDEQYDSLWVPGLVAAVAGGLVEAGIVFAGVVALRGAFG